LRKDGEWFQPSTPQVLQSAILHDGGATDTCRLPNGWDSQHALPARAIPVAPPGPATRPGVCDRSLRHRARIRRRACARGNRRTPHLGGPLPAPGRSDAAQDFPLRAAPPCASFSRLQGQPQSCSGPFRPASALVTGGRRNPASSTRPGSFRLHWAGAHQFTNRRILMFITMPSARNMKTKEDPP
jgi:hypothetical protein